MAEALVHFNAALETVSQLPSDAATAELELALQISLGNSLMSTGGFAAEGVVKAFGRARELCGRVGDSSQLVPALFGLWAFHNFGGNLKTAQELGEELLSIAERRQDPAARLMAHTSLGITMAYSGELAARARTLHAGSFGLQSRAAAARISGPDPLLVPHLAWRWSSRSPDVRNPRSE